MLHMRAIDQAAVRHLYELVNVLFTVDSFRVCWRRFGWAAQVESGREYGLYVDTHLDVPLMLDPLGTDILCAALSFCYWEEYDSAFHQDASEYRRQRTEYDDAYASSLSLAAGVLGKPKSEWRDQDANGHMAATWQGKTGVLLLQQAAFDLQYGMEINFWLEPVSLCQFLPTTPLIDWLCSRSGARHEAEGWPS
jgi:hypothetical protein